MLFGIQKEISRAASFRVFLGKDFFKLFLLINCRYRIEASRIYT